MATTYAYDGKYDTYTYTGLTASDNGDKLSMANGYGLVGCVQAFSGGGTGFNSGTLTIQVSNDGTNWATLKDLQGTDVTFTAAGLTDFSTAAQFIRPSCDGSISDVDVIIGFP